MVEETHYYFDFFTKRELYNMNDDLTEARNKLQNENHNETVINLTKRSDLIDQFLYHLPEDLKLNTRIVYLNLSRTKFGDKGAILLSTALKNCKTIKNIDISWNEITSLGSRCITELLLVKETPIERLNMKGNPIGDEGGDYLGSILRINSTLTHLNVNYCEMTPSSEIWVHALKWNTTLIKLEAIKNKGSEIVFNRTINKMVETNKAISKLKKMDISKRKLEAESRYPQAFHNACICGHYKAVKFFLELGIDINRTPKNNNQVSPLLYSVHNDDAILAKVLIACGANVTDDVVQTSMNLKSLVNIIKNAKEGKIDLSEGALEFLPLERLITDNVVKLVLSKNNMTEIPSLLIEKLQQMESLTSLDLSYNHIKVIPTKILELKNLISLNISFNEIEMLPNTKINGNLKELDIRANKIEKIIPDNLLRKSAPKILSYLNSINQPTKQWKKIKILVLGKENVGKTYLVKRLKNKEYIKDISTDGINIEEMSVSSLKTKIDLYIYDFGGQEVLYPTHSFFLTDQSIYLVIFSLYDETSHSRVDYWLKKIKSVGLIPCLTILVGTHKDMCDQSTVEAIINRFRKKCSIYPSIVDILAVSSKTSEGISELRALITKVAANHKVIKNLVPESYIFIDKHLKKLKNEGKLFMSLIEFKNLAKQYYLLQEEQCIECAQFLHNVGSIIWYNQNGTRDYVIIDVQLLADAMATVISFKTNWKNGVINHNTLKIAWKHYPENLHSGLINILKKFEIMFPIKGMKNKSIIPSMLPDRPPNYFNYPFDIETKILETMDKLERTYKLNFVASEFFSKLIVTLYHCNRLCCHSTFNNGLIISPSDFATSMMSNEDWEKAIVEASFEQKQEICFIKYNSFEESSNICHIVIYKSKDKTSELIIPIIEIVENLILVNYKKYEGSIDRYAGFNNINMPLLNILDCIILEADSIVRNNQSIPLKEIVPDFYLSNVPRINDIQRSKIIGEGGNAIVYLSTLDNGKNVAVKDMKKLNENFFHKFREFQTETQILNELDHPSIVKLFGISFKPVSMVLEYIEGQDLYTLLHDKTIKDEDLTLELRLKIALDIAKGMQYLQSKRPPIIHRDLRSPNIFICSLDKNAEVNAKISDFGLAARAYTDFKDVLMTWQWLGPEVISLDNPCYDERADIYSFAVILWEIFSRKDPFSEFEEFISRSCIQIPEDKLDDEEFINTLKAHGCYIEGNKAITEAYNKQKFIDAIVNDQLRPTIPESTPLPIQQLIKRSWCHDPQMRPTFDGIVRFLTNQIKALNEIERKSSQDKLLEKTKLNKADYLDDIDINENRSTMSSYLTIRPSMNSITLRPLDDNFSSYHETVLRRKLEPTFSIPCRLMVQYESSMVVGFKNGSISFFNLVNPTKMEASIVTPNKNEICALTNVDSTLWLGYSDSSILTYCGKKKKFKTIKSNHKGSILSILSITPKYDKNQLYVLTGDSKGQIFFWKKYTQEYKIDIGNEQPVTCMIYIEENNHIWIGSYEKIYVYDIEIGKKIAELNIPGRISSLCIDNDKIYSTSYDSKYIYSWSYKTFENLEKFEVNSRITSLELTRNKYGLYFWCGCMNGDIHVYDLLTEEMVMILEGHSDIVHHIVKQKDHSRVWSCSRDGTIRTWDYI